MSSGNEATETADRAARFVFAAKLACLEAAAQLAYGPNRDERTATLIRTVKLLSKLHEQLRSATKPPSARSQSLPKAKKPSARGTPRADASAASQVERLTNANHPVGPTGLEPLR